jgi:hypothetical protein
MSPTKNKPDFILKGILWTTHYIATIFLLLPECKSSCGRVAKDNTSFIKAVSGYCAQELQGVTCHQNMVTGEILIGDFGAFGSLP